MKFNKRHYLKRIQYSGSTAPDLDALRNLQATHLAQVPFENLDIHLNRPIELEVANFYTKIVTQNRGGFCYELNGLFYQLLLELGYEAYLISARVFDQKKGYGAEFDHLAVIVILEGQKYLTDVGFGAFTQWPLKVVLEESQEDANGTFVLDTFADPYFRVNKKIETGRQPEYIFQDKARALSDFAEMCQYHQHNPNSHFTQRRLISKPLADGRVTLSGNVLKIKKAGSIEEIPITSQAAFEKCLWDFFQVKL